MGVKLEVCRSASLRFSCRRAHWCRKVIGDVADSTPTKSYCPLTIRLCHGYTQSNGGQWWVSGWQHEISQLKGLAPSTCTVVDVKHKGLDQFLAFAQPQRFGPTSGAGLGLWWKCREWGSREWLRRLANMNTCRTNTSKKYRGSQ